MRTLIHVNSSYLGYVVPHGEYKFKGCPRGYTNRLFNTAQEAAAYVRACFGYLNPYDLS